MNTSIKVAIVGLSHGQSHLKVFNDYLEETEVVMVCDIISDYAEQVAKKYNIAKWTTHYADVLQNKDIDLVAIVTPCHLHGIQTLAALDAGKHVMVEVPMVNDSLETLWKIIRMVERTNLKVQMDNQFRWMAHTRYMKQLITEGKLGDPYYVETEYIHNIEPILVRSSDGSPTFRMGLGQVCQGTIDAGGGLYAVDTAYWLLGEEFVEVFGYGNRLNMPTRHENDHEIALFRTQSGKIARVVCSKGPKRPTIEYQAVYGTQGTLETSGRLPHPVEGPGLYGCFGEEASLYGNYGWMYDISVEGSSQANRKSTKESLDSDEVFDPAKDSQLNPMKKLEVPPLNISSDVAEKVGHGGVELLSNRYLVNAILNDTQPPGNVYESARSCAAAICAAQSIAEGRPIKIPEIVDRSKEMKMYFPMPYSQVSSNDL